MTIPNMILDLVLVFMLILGLRSGWRRGFFGIVIKGGAGILAAIISVSFYKSLGAYIKDRFLFTPIRTAIDGAVLDLVGPTPTAEELVSSVPDNLASVAGLFGVDLHELAASAVAKGGNAIESFTSGTADLIAGFLGMAVAFLGLFIGSYILLRIFSKPFSKIIMKIPLLGTVNRLFGLMLGLLLSVLLVWITVQVVALVDSAAAIEQLDVDKSFVGGFFHRTLSLSRLIGGN